MSSCLMARCKGKEGRAAEKKHWDEEEDSLRSHVKLQEGRSFPNTS